MSRVRISHPTGVVNGTIELNGSKSISNRVLIIQALSRRKFKINRLSASDDTRTLSDILQGDQKDFYNVGHAGTTFRFLTAYLAIQQGVQFLTGSSRMLERPIGPLVDALNALGCNIEYKGKHGYPPLSIKSCSLQNLKNEVEIDAGISSQYITALVLVAPMLPRGLAIHLSGNLVSESYLQLTLGIIKYFGIESSFDNRTIEIPPQEYQPREFDVEADWSAASYYYSILALAKEGTLQLKGLFRDSLQGDAAMIRIGSLIGVESSWKEDIIYLNKVNPYSQFNYNFINQPDIAQTLGVLCAAARIKNDFTGLKTLRIKETDRIAAMNIELQKIQSSFTLKYVDDVEEEHYSVAPGINFEGEIPAFDTYRDHRMAMAFAPLGTLHPIIINNPEVVSKSYPGFYEDLQKLGFDVEQTD